MDLSVAAAGAMDSMGAFGAARAEGRRPLAVIGRDPRASGEFLEAAVVAGLAGAGVGVLRLGGGPPPRGGLPAPGPRAAHRGVLWGRPTPGPHKRSKRVVRGGGQVARRAQRGKLS